LTVPSSFEVWPAVRVAFSPEVDVVFELRFQAKKQPVQQAKLQTRKVPSSDEVTATDVDDAREVAEEILDKMVSAATVDESKSGNAISAFGGLVFGTNVPRTGSLEMAGGVTAEELERQQEEEAKAEAAAEKAAQEISKVESQRKKEVKEETKRQETDKVSVEATKVVKQKQKKQQQT
jgi:hypothetical protein